MQQPGNRISQGHTSRSLRETPLLIVAGVTVFIIAALLLAGALFEPDEPGSADGGAADKWEPTATASATTPAITPAATNAGQPTMTSSGSTGAVDHPLPASATAEDANAAPDPTTPSEPAPATEDAETRDPVPTDLLDSLPGLEDLPNGYVVTAEGSLALDELAALHPEPEPQRDRLLGWGFTGAAERHFEPEPDTDVGPDGLRLLATVVVAFRTPDGARAAVESAHADAQVAEDTDVSAVEIEPLGDLSLAASGTLTIDGETLRVAYVIIQVGNRAISFAGGSLTGDPLPAVVQIANRTLDSL